MLSMFSGCELQHICGLAVMQALKNGGRYSTVGCMESDKRKANFLTNMVHHSLGVEGTCIFKDVASCQAAEAPCWVHSSGKCRVPSAKTGIGGYSCKGMSRANMYKQRGQHKIAMRDGVSSSGTSFLDMMNTAESRELHILIGENVDEMVSSTSENAYAVAQMYADYGWVCKTMEVPYNEKGHRTIRKRAWSVALHADRMGETKENCAAWVQEIGRVLMALVLPLAELENCILLADDEWVSAVRAQRKENFKDEDEDTAWQEKLSALLQSKNASWRDLKPPPGSECDDSDYKYLARRQKQTVSYQLFLTPDIFSVDVGQSIGRSPHRSDCMFNSFTTTALPYMVAENRLLTGKECLMLHGFPKGLLRKTDLDQHGVSDCLLKDLAANSFCSGAFISMLVAILSALPRKAWSDEEYDEEVVDAAMSEPDPQTVVDNILLI